VFGELEAFVAMIRDAALRPLIESIVNDAGISDRLKTAPAALKNPSRVPIRTAGAHRFLDRSPERAFVQVAVVAHNQVLEHLGR